MKNAKVLILGANGMLGHKLFLHLSSYENLDVFATARYKDTWAKLLPPELLKKLQLNVDANDFDSLISAIDLIKPELVINCIGIVKQGYYGQDPLANISINALLPHRIAQICKEYGTRLLHISTDCVFSGNKGNYSETDFPDAIDLYGKCKLLGEVSYPHCLTLRTSIIGHELQSQLGLIEWFFAQKDRIQGYTRHIYSGFPTVELASIIAHYIIPNASISGVYHLSSDPISKYDLLKLVALKYNHEIAIEPYDDTFCDRSLDSSKFRNLIGFSPQSWPEMIDMMYQDYLIIPYGKR
ncbi:MAG: NAD(P)-dependent oxidoreductase [Firmicutes bacterium HGW-Firmicutes-15]|nr:MAG: NAD(P)-dependent oxidoreductase [Firmicutes bacterium HGW-Firmicutes-15]